jgi:hypothetical protein
LVEGSKRLCACRIIYHVCITVCEEFIDGRTIFHKRDRFGGWWRRRRCRLRGWRRGCFYVRVKQNVHGGRVGGDVVQLGKRRRRAYRFPVASATLSAHVDVLIGIVPPDISAGRSGNLCQDTRGILPRTEAC